MFPNSPPARRIVLSLAFAVCGCLPVLGQTVSLGWAGASGAAVNPTGVETIVQAGAPATASGYVTSATFAWSAGPCPAAVRLKFLHPATPGNPDQTYSIVNQRGPFDVPAAAPGSSSVQVTVALSPPVGVQSGDILAITNLTSCGGPVFVQPTGGQPAFTRSSLVFAGDVTDTVVTSAGQPQFPVLARAVGAYSSLVMVGDFGASLLATDPRTGIQAAGVPVFLSSSATTSSGYFSIPDFTGEPLFPEVVVKMVDATGSPELGGDFWFFHAPLTDVSYTITVTNFTTGAFRTYTNSSSSPGQLCGGVDTSAFPPQ